LIGGSGADKLTGSGGKDIFVLTSSELGTTGAGPHDVISDFTQGSDKIDISGLYGSHAVGRIGGGSATDAANVSHYGIIYYTEGGKTFVAGDTDGIAGADFTIELSGSYSLNPTDFIRNEGQWAPASGGLDYSPYHQDLFWA
jgi:hypothetical protein